MKRISADDHYTVIGEKQPAFLNMLTYSQESMSSVFMIWNGMWAVLVTVQMKIMMHSSISSSDQAQDLFHGLQLLARMPAGYHSRI